MDRELKIRLYAGEEIALGPGKADLLDAIAREGSISGAARAMGLSYRRAWLLVDAMNRCFRSPLVESGAGGMGGGGASLTALGEKVLDRYRVMERKAADAIHGDLALLRRSLKKPPAR
ncbi:MAG: LysR family transcriptional regulator [Acidobacteria bacterium]|nr:LysR family transcriptional regulator [Acidobacteriota bacterium]